MYIFLICTFSEECAEYIDIGSLNGLFVLGRTIGFIGEHICGSFLARLCRY